MGPSSLAVWTLSLFDFSFSPRVASCDSILLFPGNRWCRAPFHILIYRPIISFAEVSLLRLRFPHFQKLVYCCVLREFFIYSGSALYEMYALQRFFSLSVAYGFIVFTMPFEEHILKCLDAFQLTHSFFFFFFRAHAFHIECRRPSRCLNSQRFSPEFLWL